MGAAPSCPAGSTFKQPATVDEEGTCVNASGVVVSKATCPAGTQLSPFGCMTPQQQGGGAPPPAGSTQMPQVPSSATSAQPSPLNQKMATIEEVDAARKAAGVKPSPPVTASASASVSTSDSSAYLLPAVLAMVLLLTFFVLLSTGSVLAVGVLWVIFAMIGFLLRVYGFITADILAPVLATPAVQPVGSATSSLTNVNLVGSEVFHIADNNYTYTDAPAVCAAYDAQLATLEQIIDAYNHGAEWCGYGWSAGGMALYPTQKGTWDALQQEVDQAKKTACGRPGVNGGYFDPASKFGVNCYGIKPQGNVKLPTPLPGTDQSAFNGAVAKFKSMLKSINLDPYSRTTWSGSTVSMTPGQQFIQSVTKEHFSMPTIPYMEVMPGQTIANSGLPIGSPYGLRGEQGDMGPAGPAGPAGPSGTPGTVGPPGKMGPTGSQGAASTAKGPTGPTGASGSLTPADSARIDSVATAATAASAIANAAKTAAQAAAKPSDLDAIRQTATAAQTAATAAQTAAAASSKKAAITSVQYGANGKWAPAEASKQAVVNGMQDGQGFQMHLAPGVGDPLPWVAKASTINWNDNAGNQHSAWINGDYIGGDTLAALNRRFAYPGAATDLRWTGSAIV